MDALSGTSWILAVLIGTSVHAGGGTITMAFENGRVQGTDGCNRYTSHYMSEGQSVRVDANIATTRMACVQSSMQQALAFLDALRASTRYRREGEQLTLFDAEGETLALFRSGRL